MNPEMTYCGKLYYTAEPGSPIHACDSTDGSCPSCLRAHIARLEARVGELEAAAPPDLANLIRKRYPRMLERGNPMYDGVLAEAVEAQAAAQAGGVVVPA